MVQSAIINEAIVFVTVLSMRALLQRTPREKIPESLRFFTVQSNLFCGLTALLLLLCEFFGSMPAWVATLKYMGTVAVAVTFCTVFLYLLPASGSVRGLLDEAPEFIMHLVTPVLAIVSFILFENNELSPWIIPLGILPVILYGWLYLNRVIVAGTWNDMYGFNRNGKWKKSFALMILETVLVSVLLWLL